MFQDVDVIRVLDKVVRSVRFYAKRGINIELIRPAEPVPHVQIRSHHLIRSLLLIFVELVEASSESGIELHVALAIEHEDELVTLTITVTAGPFSLPPVLLAQIEKGGALARHVARAGGSLTYTLDHEGNLEMSISMPATSLQQGSTESNVAEIGRAHV